MILKRDHKINMNLLTLSQCQTMYIEKGVYILCSRGNLVELLLEKDK